MSHTYTQNLLHIVFSTKNRRKAIPERLQPRVWSYIVGICKNLDIPVHAIGGADDHLHLLIQLPPTLPLAKAVSAIKSNSSRWAHENGYDFAWQEGYSAFSVSHSLLTAAARYIRNQKAHHQTMAFEAEFLALLKKHAVVFDPKYVLG
jgi:putative transposase